LAERGLGADFADAALLAERGLGADFAERGDGADFADLGVGADVTDCGVGALTADAGVWTETGLAGVTTVFVETGEGALTVVAVDATVTVVVVLGRAVAVGDALGSDATVGAAAPDPAPRTTAPEAGVVDGASSASAVPNAAPAPTAPSTPLTIQVRDFIAVLLRVQVLPRRLSLAHVRPAGDVGERFLMCAAAGQLDASEEVWAASRLSHPHVAVFSSSCGR
jgi:hypothetical protein